MAGLELSSLTATLPNYPGAGQSHPGTISYRGCCHCEASQRRNFMGATTDKVKGAANEAIGKAKQGVGEAVGSDRLQGEGVIQEVKGKGQKAVGDAKEAPRTP